MKLSKESRVEPIGTSEVQTSIVGFIARFLVVHTIVYFIAGLIFSELFNYKELFASSEYPNMRTFDSILIMLGPLLQVFRGAVIALVFVPFRKAIMENKWGWIYLFAAQWILLNVAADSITPGAIEAFIYTDIPIAHHFITYPEFTFHTLIVSLLFWTWQKKSNKILNIIFISVFIIMVAILILGVFTS